MINENEILKRILLNMKYDSSMTLSENYDLLSEQTVNVGKYTVIFDGSRVRIDSPSGGEYYWFPDGKWYKLTYNLGNEEWNELTPDKNYEALKVLKDVLIKSGIGSAFWIKNKEQGDQFRSWVIKKDPQFAKQIDLSPQGPYDNEYIRKAWAKYGREYAKVRRSQTPQQKGIDSVISQLKQKGLDGSGAISENHAYALAAIRATKKLTDILQNKIAGKNFATHNICVKKVGSTCSPGNPYTFDTFNTTWAKQINNQNPIVKTEVGQKEFKYFVSDEGSNKIEITSQDYNKLKNTSDPELLKYKNKLEKEQTNLVSVPLLKNSLSVYYAKGYKPSQYMVLTNFYFDYGKIMSELQNVFKYDENAYKSELFPDGWWNWFTTYWGTDNITTIKFHPDPNQIELKDTADINEYTNKYFNDLTNGYDTHGRLTIIELSALILGLIPTPFSPFLLGLSTAAGLADAGVYLAEGDKYMASMMLALEVIPGGELFRVFKGSKVVPKLGKEGTIELIQRGLKGELKTGEEVIYQSLVKELKTSEKIVLNTVQETVGNNLKTGLRAAWKASKKGLDTFFKLITLVYKTIGSLPSMILNVGGTMYTVDQIYLAKYGRDEDRQNSEIRQLYYLLKSGKTPEEAEMEKTMITIEDFLKSQNSAELGAKMLDNVKNVDLKEEKDMDKYFRDRAQLQNQTDVLQGAQKERKITTPKIDEILNKTAAFYYGMSSEDIKSLKLKLKENYGKYFGDELDKTIENPDYDDTFYYIINKFQTEILPTYYGINIDENELNSIGVQTYNQIIKQPQDSTKDPEFVDKDNYDFYMWNERFKNWMKIEFDLYKKLKDNGQKVEKRIKQ